MNHRISFTVTGEQWQEIESYVKAKKRWRDPAALARDGVFQLMERYPARTGCGLIPQSSFVGGTAHASGGILEPRS